jgi:hypothetical protein
MASQVAAIRAEEQKKHAALNDITRVAIAVVAGWTTV